MKSEIKKNKNKLLKYNHIHNFSVGLFLYDYIIMIIYYDLYMITYNYI